MDSALVSVNGHTEFFKKGISTGLKSGSVAEGRVNTSGKALWTLVSLQANKIQNSDNKGDYLQDHLSNAIFKGNR